MGGGGGGEGQHDGAEGGQLVIQLPGLVREETRYLGMQFILTVHLLVELLVYRSFGELKLRPSLPQTCFLPGR